MEYAKSVGRLWPSSHYLYGQKVVRIKRRTAYFLFSLIMMLAYMPWQLASAQAGRFQASDYQPLYLLNDSARLAQAAPAGDRDISAAAQAGLANLLADWTKIHPEHTWSVALKTISGPAISGGINQDTVFGTASIYKLLLTYKLFTTYNLDQLSQISLKVEGRPQASLASCVNLMLTVSDNPCGEAVGNFLGWRSSGAVLKNLGLAHTDLNSSRGPLSSAGDVTEYLVKLDSGQLLKPAAKDYVEGLMLNQKLRAGIPAGCTSCTVADKTGDLGRIRHDAAIVSYAGGKYVLTIFTDGASYGQIAQLTGQIQQFIQNQAKH